MLRRYAGDRPKRALHGSKTPCGDLKEHTVCSDLCCRNFLVTLAQEDLDDGLEVLEPFVDVLKRHVRGHCHYLDEQTARCSIHELRPMPCRAFDCREDQRSDPLRRVTNPEVPFVEARPRSCESCGTKLELSMAVAADCAGRAICMACGAGYHVVFSYALRQFAVHHDDGSTPLSRRTNLLRALVYHQRFAEALPHAEALAAEHPDDHGLQLELGATLTELGRFEQARPIFERLRTAEAALELAWLERREGRLAQARDRLFSVLGALSYPSRVRAAVELGRIALARKELDQAAIWFVQALRGRMFVRNPMLKEFVLDVLHGSPEGRVAVEAVLLGRPRNADSALPG